MTIRDCIFAVESLAHLQGKEAELLPLVEMAKSEHEALKVVVNAANSLVFNAPSRLIESENEYLFALIEALEKLK